MLVPTNKEKIKNSTLRIRDGAQHRGVTTGISTGDQLKTIQLLISQPAPPMTL